MINRKPSHASKQVTIRLLSSLMIARQTNKSLDEVCDDHRRSTYLTTKSVTPNMLLAGSKTTSLKVAANTTKKDPGIFAKANKRHMNQ